MLSMMLMFNNSIRRAKQKTEFFFSFSEKMNNITFNEVMFGSYYVFLDAFEFVSL